MPVRKHIDVPAIVAAYQAGATLRELAAEHRVSHNMIRCRLIRAGVKLRPTSQIHLPAQTQQAIVDAYVGGAMMTDIMAEHGVLHQTIRRVVLAAGEPLRPPGGQVLINYEVIRRLERKGWPVAAVAILTDVSESWVRKIVQAGYQAEDLLEEKEQELAAAG